MDNLRSLRRVETGDEIVIPGRTPAIFGKSNTVTMAQEAFLASALELVTRVTTEEENPSMSRFVLSNIERLIELGVVFIDISCRTLFTLHAFPEAEEAVVQVDEHDSLTLYMSNMYTGNLWKGRFHSVAWLEMLRRLCSLPSLRGLRLVRGTSERTPEGVRIFQAVLRSNIRSLHLPEGNRLLTEEEIEEERTVQKTMPYLDHPTSYVSVTLDKISFYVYPDNNIYFSPLPGVPKDACSLMGLCQINGVAGFATDPDILFLDLSQSDFDRFKIRSKGRIRCERVWVQLGRLENVYSAFYLQDHGHFSFRGLAHFITTEFPEAPRLVRRDVVWTFGSDHAISLSDRIDPFVWRGNPLPTPEPAQLSSSRRTLVLAEAQKRWDIQRGVDSNPTDSAPVMWAAGSATDTVTRLVKCQIRSLMKYTLVAFPKHEIVINHGFKKSKVIELVVQPDLVLTKSSSFPEVTTEIRDSLVMDNLDITALPVLISVPSLGVIVGNPDGENTNTGIADDFEAALPVKKRRRRRKLRKKDDDHLLHLSSDELLDHLAESLVAGALEAATELINNPEKFTLTSCLQRGEHKDVCLLSRCDVTNSVEIGPSLPCAFRPCGQMQAPADHFTFVTEDVIQGLQRVSGEASFQQTYDEKIVNRPPDDDLPSKPGALNDGCPWSPIKPCMLLTSSAVSDKCEELCGESVVSLQCHLQSQSVEVSEQVAELLQPPENDDMESDDTAGHSTVTMPTDVPIADHLATKALREFVAAEESHSSDVLMADGDPSDILSPSGNKSGLDTPICNAVPQYEVDALTSASTMMAESGADLEILQSPIALNVMPTQEPTPGSGKSAISTLTEKFSRGVLSESNSKQPAISKPAQESIESRSTLTNAREEHMRKPREYVRLKDKNITSRAQSNAGQVWCFKRLFSCTPFSNCRN